jgi:hypothetical protein
VSDSISVTGNAQALPMGGIAAVAYLFVRVLSGSLTLLLTSSAGADQAVPVSGRIELYLPATPTITAIKTTGTADIEYVVAGA